MKDATLVTDGDRPAVRLERQLPDPPEVVWGALTEPERLREWFPCDVLVAGGEWRVGAAITFRFPPDLIEMTLTGEVLEVERPCRLAFSWGEEMLHFELSAQDGGTRLVLIDTLPADAAARNAAGWEVCLDGLAADAAPADRWKERFAVYSATFEPILGPQEGPPSGYEGTEAGVTR
jgi:uncharacterized protein YndB with AHSA1/START domain